jgi:hypothetical protein
MDLIALIEKARTDREMTPRQYAAFLGVSEGELSLFRNGHRKRPAQCKVVHRARVMEPQIKEEIDIFLRKAFSLSKGEDKTSKEMTAHAQNP